MPTLKSYLDQWFVDHLDDRETFNLQTDAKIYSLARAIQTIANSLDTGGTPPTGTVGGDLTGTLPNPTIASGAVTSDKIAASTITMNNLKFSATSVTGTGSDQVVSHTLGVVPSLVLPVALQVPDGGYNLSIVSTSSSTITVNFTATAFVYLLLIA